MRNSLQEFVKQRLEELGIEQKEAARRGGFRNRSFINDILSGKKGGIQSRNAQKLAKALDMNPADLAKVLAGFDADTVGYSADIPIVGTVEAGAWREMPRYFEDGVTADLTRVVAERSRRYPEATHWAVEARDDSMNRATPYPILPGSRVLCIDMVAADLTPETGKIYVVRRTLDAGKKYEFTVKRARVFRDRIELHPESTNPAHQSITVAHGDTHNDIEIELVGLVYGVQGSFE